MRFRMGGTRLHVFSRGTLPGIKTPSTVKGQQMAYVYVNLLLQDPETMAAYREKAGAALQKHGAKVLVSTPQQTVIEGTRDATGIGVILQFASPEAAKGWINDPELQDVHALRQAAGRSAITLLA
ncbi:DUF1330 domain-containing protein [Phaeobacter sp. JH20_02]|uniref:DUF1330 domain-containing protein n=1 Tax=Phaeobacter TaxID=302485 RepID=UPI0035A59CA5